MQQRNVTQYRQYLDRQVNLAQQRTELLQQQRRMAQYRYQQDYYDRLRRQQLSLQNLQNYDYYNDPYYYTDWNYQYLRGGTYYQTNQYGADLLRQAVNNGYREGFLAGEADRQDGWRPSFRNAYAYQDADFGYNGLYVAPEEYQYYFREGFRRGYEDGYNSRYQYGNYVNGNYSILDVVLGGILNLTVLR